MARSDEESGRWMTRRDVLAQAALGAVAASLSPYVGRAQGLLAKDGAAARLRESFDFGWKFLKGDAELTPGSEKMSAHAGSLVSNSPKPVVNHWIIRSSSFWTLRDRMLVRSSARRIRICSTPPSLSIRRGSVDS